MLCKPSNARSLLHSTLLSLKNELCSGESGGGHGQNESQNGKYEMRVNGSEQKRSSVAVILRVISLFTQSVPAPISVDDLQRKPIETEPLDTPHLQSHPAAI